MQQLARVFLILSLAIGASADEPRPSYGEYKEGQKNISNDADAEAAKQAKMAAVDKVISMMQDLQLQVLAEGEAEAATYNKFACFCKTTQKDKTQAIEKGKEDKADLSAEIEALQKKRDMLDKAIAALIKDIKKTEKEMKAATHKSDAARKVYEVNEADLDAALYALKNAIEVLKKSETPSLVQLQSVSKTLRQAALLADALGLGGQDVQKAATFFLQQGDVPVEFEDYKFHSAGIIETMEKLLDSFRKTKADVDADEVQRVQEYDTLMQEKTDHVKAQTLALDQAKEERALTIEEIGTASQELTIVSATLLDDMEYLDELNRICSDKAKTWDQRTKLRANELTAITQAMEIIKTTVVEKTSAETIRFAQAGAVLHLGGGADAVTSSEGAMEAIEAEAEASEGDQEAVGFLQKRSVQEHSKGSDDGGRQLVVSLLKGKGQALKSTLLVALANRIAADPFAKVKKLIQELIERLLTEAANEANQKGWCDKAMADAKQKRDYAAEEIADLNAKMAKLEALSDELGEKIAEYTDDISKLKDARAEAQKVRSEESEENANTVKEAKQGLAAITMAIDIMEKFYKTSAKATVDLSLAQGPLDDAPDAGFKIGEAYKGLGGEAGGIVGMMEVIQSDFKRTIKETTEAEKQAEQDHLEFMTESGKSLAEKEVQLKESTKLKNETDENLNAASEDLNSQMVILSTSIKELIELKATCIDTGMSYAERVARREEEIEALKKALCVLNAYAAYGPDGLKDAC
jgi:hypothetical protein